MRNKKAALAVTAVLLVGGALSTAGPASAANSAPPGGGSWDHTWTTTDARHGGTVYVEEHGDVIDLCDTAADGYAPRIEVFAQTSNGQYNPRYFLAATDGNGTCTGVSASLGGVYDLPEHDNILINIWLGPNQPGPGETSYYFLNDH